MRGEKPAAFSLITFAALYDGLDFELGLGRGNSIVPHDFVTALLIGPRRLADRLDLRFLTPANQLAERILLAELRQLSRGHGMLRLVIHDVELRQIGGVVPEALREGFGSHEGTADFDCRAALFLGTLGFGLGGL